MEELNDSINMKCKEVNLGKTILNQNRRGVLYNKINKISEDNYKFLQQEINGPYRFGCI